MICLVGGCPSSGSTLLSDLLDSTPFTASGPELEFFCNPSIYDFEAYKKKQRRTGKLFPVRSTGIYFRSDFLNAYGFTHKEWVNLIRTSKSLPHFTEAFTQRFLAFRQKETQGIVFEKTPQNTNCIGEFLDAFPDAYYLHIVRNPANVFSSLRKRNFGTYTAGATWLLYAAKAKVFANHPRFIKISYEELISNPFTSVERLLDKIMPDFNISANEIKLNFENNTYRQNVSGISTWENQNRTSVNSTQKTISNQEMELLGSFLTYKVGSQYASTFSLEQLSFKQAMQQNGYDFLLEELGKITPRSFEKRNGLENKKLITKWIKGFVSGNYSFTDLTKMFNTLELVKG